MELVQYVVVLTILVDPSQALSCLSCYFQHNLLSGMSLGLHACLRPYDVTIHQSVISTECDDVTASCVEYINSNDTYVEVIRSCRSDCESVYYSDVITNWSYHRQCCNTRDCNNHQSQWSTAHPDAESIAINSVACSADGPAHLYDNGTIRSPDVTHSKLASLMYFVPKFTNQSVVRQYPARSHCEWEITANRGKSILVDISSLHLEASPSDGCVYDKLGFYDVLPTGQLFEIRPEVCGDGQVHHGSIVSANNHILIRFLSDDTISGEGFVLNYKAVTSRKPGTSYDVPISAVEEACTYGITFNGQYGSFRSPTMADVNSFTAIDDIESSGDVDDSTGESSNNSSDGIWSSMASTSASEALSDDGFLYDANSSHLADAEQSEHQQLNKYPNDMRCMWNIENIDQHKMIQIIILQLDLEFNSECKHDYLQINVTTDHDNSSTPLSSRYCGHRQLIPIILNTTNNLVEMEFRSDATQTARGLFGFFRVVPTYLTGDSENIICQPLSTPFVVTSRSGTLTSPSDPTSASLYMNDADCAWLIRAEPGEIIHLEFESFRLEGSIYSTCDFDYLVIYDGHSPESILSGPFCGIFHSHVFVQSCESSVLVHFVSDSSVNYSGFRLSYRMVTLPRESDPVVITIPPQKNTTTQTLCFQCFYNGTSNDVDHSCSHPYPNVTMTTECAGYCSISTTIVGNRYEIHRSCVNSCEVADPDNCCRNSLCNNRIISQDIIKNENNKTDILCYECAYVKSSDFIHGAECAGWNNHEVALSTVQCPGSCTIISRIDFQTGDSTIQRQCDNGPIECADTTIHTGKLTYQKLCCNTDFCNNGDLLKAEHITTTSAVGQLNASNHVSMITCNLIALLLCRCNVEYRISRNLDNLVHILRFNNI